MPLQDIAVLPDPPARSDPPEDFIAKADALLSSLPAFVDQLNILATQLEATAALINVAPAYADAGLRALTGKTPAANKLPYYTGTAASALADFTAAARSFLAAADASAQLDALGVSAFMKSLLNDADAAAAQDTLELVPGTDVQAFDADLAAIAALATTAFGRSVLTIADGAGGRTLFGSNGSLGYGSNASGKYFSVPIQDRTYYLQIMTGSTPSNGWSSAINLPVAFTTEGWIVAGANSLNTGATEGNKIAADLVGLDKFKVGSDDSPTDYTCIAWGY
ncbi:hypothetical protein Saro_0662 [Novosphingobium aromaticivorans DSM 12444]|uniref:Uncharacterized protein n=1 Tax=Novosphingobium aromaticivorans (strain ATCC 700278 / DSM 12444 / CCUG 56034 / CIP 105152 / NBRC 16084 / F199) TaxID=279238 RepID=Q2GAL4_NOVAD|nr:hypothetical protein [Novosphingobium aromaticivorans]ABD25109.1 hypothetical protein Saro_0662 [Novosphingobium aromaticivorans DSM 12444]SCY95728.1 hypothetical protein SAMN05660666_03874 [Novosphingobium aromaticivorans]